MGRPLATVSIVTISRSVAPALPEGNALIRLYKEMVCGGEPFHRVTAVRRYPGESTGDLHDLHVGFLLVA
jgi:hypothetical protein